jgi:tRNA dimethylallyltransferase
VTPLVVIVGPTASGKSDLALAVARALGGEVINADSTQLYEGMDIGTAKLSLDDRQGIPHHLLDIWPVTTTASLAEFQALARTTIKQLHERNTIPVLVGGSGMYVHAVVDEWQIPGTDPTIRASLQHDLDEQGPQQLFARLQKLDPVAAEGILPTNGRRIVRALEVVELQGSFTAQLPRPDDSGDRLLFGLDVPRDVLDERIIERVDSMWDEGLVAEVRGLVDVGLRDGETARRALGYAQVLSHLDGVLTEEEAHADTVRGTKRLARRQGSWFRRDQRITWLRPAKDEAVEQILARVQGITGTSRTLQG